MLGSESKKIGLGIRMLEISWVASRVIVLVILQFGLETIYKVGWLEFLGPQEIQRLVFDILKKVMLTLYLWLFLSIFKKFVLPLIMKLFTPVVDKVVTDPKTKEKQVMMVSRYFMYVAYVVAVLAFQNTWNDFLPPLIYINEMDKFTLALGLSHMMSQSGASTEYWNLLMAAATVMVLPVLLLYVVGQRHIVQGMVLTGIKG